MLTGFQPGNLQQDVYTLPIEAGLIAMMNETYTRTSRPMWPFATETTSYPGRRSSRHPGSVALLVGTPLISGTLGGLAVTSPHFKVWFHMRGWMHAHLLTEIATTFSKTSFQRKRPFYDAESSEEKVTGTRLIREDDRKSFFSGHSSHAFAFATYASLLLSDYATHPVVVWVSAPLLFGTAAIVGNARYEDGQHHLLDVVVGGLVGATIAGTVEKRVNEVAAESATESVLQEEKKSYQWRPIASTRWDVESKNRIYFLGANVRF